jgi:DNA polymerase
MAEETLNSVEISSILTGLTRNICKELSLWLDSQRDLGAQELPHEDIILQPQAPVLANARHTAEKPAAAMPVNPAPQQPAAQPAAQPVKPTAPEASKPAQTTAKPASTGLMGSMQSFRAMRNAVPQNRYDTPEERRLGLNTLNARMNSCRQCVLGSTRRGVLCGYGPADASMMFVAAGGNPRELDKGRLMTDDAAALFDKIVTAMGTLDPEAAADRIYMTNVIKCAAVPPRGKSMDVARSCLANLRQEVRIVSPKVIVIWGELALKAMFGGDMNISQARGTWQIFEGVPAIATHHPLEMLKNPKLKGRVWSDLQAAVARLKELNLKI